MKKVSMTIGVIIISLFLSGCILEPYKGKDQIVEYFNVNYDNFNDIQSYLSGSNFYFSCWDTCKRKNYQTGNIGLGEFGNFEIRKFSHLSNHEQIYIKKLAKLFTGETTEISNETNYIYIGMNNSLFGIIYRKEGDIKNYYGYTGDNYYFGNLTGNWYYSFSTEYRN